MSELAPTPTPAPTPSPAPAPAPAPSPTPTPTPPKNDGAWYENADYGFDTETRKFYEGKNYPDLKTALTSLRHADQVARDRNVLPKPDPANTKDWEGWEALGWHKDPAQYTQAFKKPEVKDGQLLDEGLFSAFQKDAHDLRIPAGAAQELYSRAFGKAYERIAELDAQGAQSRTQLDNALKTEWGDKYDGNVELAKRGMKAFGVNMDDAAELERMVGSPRMVKMFHGLASKLGEDNLVTSGSPANAQSPQAARAERLRLETDAAWMAVFNDVRHPQHKDYVARRNALMELEARK